MGLIALYIMRQCAAGTTHSHSCPLKPSFYLHSHSWLVTMGSVVHCSLETDVHGHLQSGSADLSRAGGQSFKWTHMHSERGQGRAACLSGARRQASIGPQSTRAKAAKAARAAAAAEAAAPAAPFSTVAGAGAGAAPTGAAAGLGATTGPGATIGAAVGLTAGPGAPVGAATGAGTGDSSRSMYTCSGEGQAANDTR